MLQRTFIQTDKNQTMSQITMRIFIMSVAEKLNWNNPTKKNGIISRKSSLQTV